MPHNYNFPGTQCCGSRVKKAPDPGSGSTTKNLSICNPKILSRALRDMIRDLYSGSKIWFFPSKIPNRGFRGKKAPDPDPQHCWYLFVVNFFHFYFIIPLCIIYYVILPIHQFLYNFCSYPVYFVHLVASFHSSVVAF